jgi:hypothetical protein
MRHLCLGGVPLIACYIPCTGRRWLLSGTGIFLWTRTCSWSSLDVVEPGSAAEKAFQKALGKGLPKVFAGPFARGDVASWRNRARSPDRPGPFVKGSESPASPTRKAFEGARGEMSPTCARGRGAVTSRRHERLAASARAVARQVSPRRAARCGITRAWSSVRAPCAHQQEVP